LLILFLEGGVLLAYVTLAFVSVALLLAVVALIKERRLRLALQGILRRMIDRWRNHETAQNHDHSCRRNVDADIDGMRRRGE
jgi:hypothetical protein